MRRAPSVAAGRSDRVDAVAVVAVTVAIGGAAAAVTLAGASGMLAVVALGAAGAAVWLLTAWMIDRRTFARVGQVARVERRLVSLLRPHVRTVALGLVLTGALTLVGLAKPVPTKILIDDVLGDGELAGLSDEGALGVAVLATLGLFVLSGVLTLVQTRILYGLTQRLIRDLRAQLFRHLSLLSLRFHDARGVGDIAYRVSADTYSIHSLLLGGLVPLTSGLLTLVGTVVVMATLDLVLAGLALLSVPVAAIVSRRFGGRIRSSSELVQERESDVWSHAEQTFAGIRTVQAFAREPFEAERFDDRADRSSSAMLRLVTQQTVFALAVDAVLGVGLAIVTYAAARRALDGALTVGEVVLFLAYAATVYGPVSELASVFGEVQSAAAGANRVFEVLDESAPISTRPAVAPAGEVGGELRLEGVGFEYGEGSTVLTELDLVVERGTTVALVGPTGAGKSTIVSLLLRLYDPTAGRVCLDGRDLRDLPVSWLRDAIALVPQDPVLFPATVRENIRYGRLDASDEEVEEAARRANILEELLADPRGLDAPVGDRGVTLSGGQRQRVAIARAFLRDAPVVLLDEPTSALDAATEVLVMDAVWRLVEGRTCVVIAHRLSTVHRADRVVVVDKGRVVQAGRHDRLIRSPGLYRSLHAARFGSTRPPGAGAGRRASKT